MQAIRSGRTAARGVALSTTALAMVLALASCGGSGGGGGRTDGGTGGGGATPGTQPASANVALLAGALGGTGFADGPAATARLCNPGAMAEGADGTVYLIDCDAVRAWSPDGGLRTIAGSRRIEPGATDGRGDQARFGWRPEGLALDAAGALYVADGANASIRKVTPDGVVSTVAGRAGEAAVVDGAGSVARFRGPKALAFDAGGNLLIGDTGLLRRMASDGTVSTFAGSPVFSGVRDGALADAYFGDSLCAMAFDANGALFVTDSLAGAVRKVANGRVTTFAWPPLPSDETAPPDKFYDTCGLAINTAGELLISENLGQVIDKVAANGSVSVFAGVPWSSGTADGRGSTARFNRPDKLLALHNGDTLVADQFNATLRRVSPDGSVRTVLGMPAQRGAVDGAGAAARFHGPQAVVADPDGNVFVADWDNHNIRKITPDGTVTTWAGSTAGAQGLGFSETRDGTGIEARFYNPAGIAIDVARNLYVTDANAHVVRKITPAGVVSTVAGQVGQGGYVDGDAGSALLEAPWGVVVDRQGVVYFSERFRGTVRRIETDGRVSTWFGDIEDGVLHGLVGLAVDADGGMYLSDLEDHTIRKVTAAGAVSTLAGRAGISGQVDGDGAAARFLRPYGLSLGADGNLYVADVGNSAVRRVTPQGMVSTVAGGNGDQRAVVLGERGRLNNPLVLAVLPGVALRFAVLDEGALLIVTPRQP